VEASFASTGWMSGKIEHHSRTGDLVEKWWRLSGMMLGGKGG
jgi:hypothetical protein